MQRSVGAKNGIRKDSVVIFSFANIVIIMKIDKHLQ